MLAHWKLGAFDGGKLFLLGFSLFLLVRGVNSPHFLSFMKLYYILLALLMILTLAFVVCSIGAIHSYLHNVWIDISLGAIELIFVVIFVLKQMPEEQIEEEYE